MGNAERRDRTIKSTLDCLDRAIERMSLNIDDQILTDGTYRSGHGQQLKQPPPHHPPPSYPLQYS